MVPIRHIGAWNLFKFCLEERGILNRALPENMSDTIIACHITVGCCHCNDRIDSSLDNLLIVHESKENWLCVRILNFD